MKLLVWSLERLKTLLRGPALFIIPVAAACLMALPSLFSGLCLDDYFARAVLVRGDSLPGFLDRSPLDEFSFSKRNDPEALRASMERGIWPWWTSPSYRIAFCRPLASLTHWFDYTIFQDSYWAMHLHSLFWYAALVLAAVFAYRRFLSPPWIAGMAALLYALDSGHALGATYLNNRYVLMSGICSLVCLILYDRWRRGRNIKSAAAACLAYAVGLFAGEATISICAYLFAYAVCIERGSARSRLSALVPFAAITVLWRIVYVALSFSASGTSFYTDPLHDTAAFIAAFPLRISALLLSQFTMAHAAMTNFLGPGLSAAYCAGALVALLILYRALQPLLADRVIRFFGLATLLSMIPLCAAVPDDRLLIIPGFGAIGIIAAFLAAVGSRAADACRVTKLQKNVAVLFFVFHCLLAPMQFQSNAFSLSFLQRPLDNVATVISGCVQDSATQLVLLNAPLDIGVSYLPFMLMERRSPVPSHMLLLSAGESEVIVKRTDTFTLQVRVPQGLLGGVYERIFSGDHAAFRAGQTIDFSHVSIRIEGLTSDGRPADMRYVFRQPLESRAIKWFYWTRQGLKPFRMPNVGQSVTIPKLPCFLNLMLARSQ